MKIYKHKLKNAEQHIQHLYEDHMLLTKEHLPELHNEETKKELKKAFFEYEYVLVKDLIKHLSKCNTLYDVSHLIKQLK